MFGGLGTFSAWVVVMVMNPVTAAIGLGWMIFGLLVYLGYRRRHNLPIKETVTVVLPEPLDVEEVEFKSVLVPFEDDPFSEQTIGTAARLAVRKGAASTSSRCSTSPRTCRSTRRCRVSRRRRSRRSSRRS